MPDTLEFPRMRRSVVPLVCSRNSLVSKFVSDRLPAFPAVVGPLHNLPAPAARLRRVNAIGVCRRRFHVIQFPARKMRAADLPLFPLAVSGQNKRAFARSHQYAYPAHFDPFHGCIGIQTSTSPIPVLGLNRSSYRSKNAGASCAGST